MGKKAAVFFYGKKNFGGAERRLARIMNQICMDNYQVDFIFKEADTYEVLYKKYEEVVGSPLLFGFHVFKKYTDIFNFVIKEKYNAIFFTGPYTAVLPFLTAGKLSGAKCVQLQVSIFPSIWKFDNLFTKAEFYLVGKIVDQIDVLYPNSYDLYSKLFGREKISITPCPSTDLSKYAPNEIKKRTIVFASRWMKNKNVLLCVKAALSIGEVLQGNNYKVILCGYNGESTDYIATVKNTIAQSKYKNLFEMPGFVDTKNYLADAEVFLSLQDITNYPSQSLLEAIASGCYIIATNTGDTELLVNEKFGVLCNTTVADVSRALKEYIYKTTDQKKEIVRSAREFAVENLDLSKSVEHYKQIISY